MRAAPPRVGCAVARELQRIEQPDPKEAVQAGESGLVLATVEAEVADLVEAVAEAAAEVRIRDLVQEEAASDHDELHVGYIESIRANCLGAWPAGLCCV